MLNEWNVLLNKQFTCFTTDRMGMGGRIPWVCYACPTCYKDTLHIHFPYIHNLSIFHVYCCRCEFQVSLLDDLSYFYSGYIGPETERPFSFYNFYMHSMV